MTGAKRSQALPRKEQAASHSRKAFSLSGGAGGKRERFLRHRVSKEPRKDPLEFSQAQRAGGLSQKACASQRTPPCSLPSLLPLPFSVLEWSETHVSIRVGGVAGKRSQPHTLPSSWFLLALKAQSTTLEFGSGHLLNKRLLHFTQSIPPVKKHSLFFTDRPPLLHFNDLDY